MDYLRENDNKRWVGYFDLLGTKQLIQSKKDRHVFQAYSEALSSLSTLGRHQSNIYQAWFSDTFLIYAEDDSLDSFNVIEKTCRWFVTSLIWHNIPVRGSLSCNQLYVDHANSLYLGLGLLEAYEWGENQDWIGFLLCPSSIQRLQELDKSTKDYKHYIEYAVPPFLKEIPETGCICAACILGNWVKEGNTDNSVLLRNLREMRDKQSSPSVKQKYDKSIEFIERNQTCLNDS